MTEGNWETSKMIVDQILIHLVATAMGKPHFADLLIRQYMVETASGKSWLYLNANNLFGMRVPQKRKWWGYDKVRRNDAGEMAYFSMYRNKVLSIVDRLERAKHFKENGTISDVIRTKYATAKNYKALLEAVRPAPIYVLGGVAFLLGWALSAFLKKHNDHK